LVLVAVVAAPMQVSASGVVFFKTLAGPGMANIYSSGLSYDAVLNRLVVADSGLNRIDFYSLAGTYLGQFGMFGTTNGKFRTPRDTAVDASSNIYVADAENSRIQKFDSTGAWQWSVGAQGTCSTCMSNPIGVGWDKQNNVLLVASTATSQIKAFSSSGTWLWTSPATIGISNPRDVARGPDGRIWISDYTHQQVKAFNVSATGVWASSTPAIVLGDGLPAGHGDNQLNSPYNMDFSPDGSIVYVADTGNERVARWNISGPKPVWLAQIGSRCIAKPCPNPPASIGLLEQLRRVLVVPSGNIYADDLWGNGIDYYAPDGTVLGEIEGFHAPPSGFAQAFGVAVAPDGTTYGVDRLNQRIERFDSAGNFLNSSGVRGSSADQESWPETVAVTPDGTVWVADTRHDRLQHWLADLSGIIEIVGSSGTTLGHFNSIEGVTSDAAGNVWVADTRNNRIQKYTPSTQTFRAFGSLGTGPGQFSRPQGLAVSSSAIYVADTANKRVQKLDLSGNPIASYSAGLAGTQDVALGADGTLWVLDTPHNRIVHVSADLATTFTDGFGSFGSGPMQFFQPHSLEVFGTTLFVADTYNNRIQEFSIT
jgi:sugar lactone lactonase YvrE